MPVAARLAISILVATALLAPSYPASSAIKAGAKCSALGKVQKSGSKSFTCIKKGKKLIWSLTKRPTPASPSSTSTAENKESPTKEKTRREIAFNEVQKIYSQTKPINATFQYIISENAPKEFLQEIKPMKDISIQFWQSIFTPPSVFPLIYGNSREIDWVSDQLAKYGHRLEDYTLEEVSRDYARASKGNLMHNENGMVTYYLIGDQQSREVPQNLFGMRAFIAHEYVHAVAASIFNHREEGIPSWSVEGSANFFGFALTALRTDKPLESLGLGYRQNMERARSESSAIVPHTLTRQELFDAIRKSEISSGNDGLFSYTVGPLLTEILVADHGFEKFISWWRLSAEKNWEIAFEEVFGIDIDKWYEEVAIPYVVEESVKAIPEIPSRVGTTTPRTLSKRPEREFVRPGYKSETALKALKEFDAYPKLNRSLAEVEYFFGPRGDQTLSKDIRRIVDATVKQWRDFDIGTKKYSVIYGSDSDFNWFVEQVGKVANPLSANEVSNYRSQLNRNGDLMGGRFGSTSSVLFFLLTPDRLKNFTHDWRSLRLASATVDLLQTRITQDQRYLLPCWVRDGSSLYYGIAGARQIDKISFFGQRKNVLGNWYQSRNQYNLKSMSASEFIQLINKLDGTNNSGCEDFNFSSPVGFMLTERLVAEFGHAKVVDWWAKVPSAGSWKSAFGTTFGLSFDKWLTDSGAPYIREEMRNWVKPIWLED